MTSIFCHCTAVCMVARHHCISLSELYLGVQSGGLEDAKLQILSIIYIKSLCRSRSLIVDSASCSKFHRESSDLLNVFNIFAISYMFLLQAITKLLAMESKIIKQCNIYFCKQGNHFFEDLFTYQQNRKKNKIVMKYAIIIANGKYFEEIKKVRSFNLDPEYGNTQTTSIDSNSY